MASATLSASAASPWTISTWSCHSRSARFCGRRAMTRTWKPAARSSGIRRPPMYPVAPVTRASWLAGREGGTGGDVTGRSSQSSDLSQLFEGRGHAGLGLVAEPSEGRFHQRCNEPGDALEDEVRRVGHLGVAVHLPEGHGVQGYDRLILTSKADVPVRDQINDHVGEPRLATGEGRGVQVLRAERPVARGPDGLDRARVPLGCRGEVRQIGEYLLQRLLDGDGPLQSHGCPFGLRRAMEAFRAVANATQPAYGRNIFAAGRSTWAARRVRSSVDTSIRRISARAQRGRRALKNSQFHPALSIRFAPKAVANARRSPGSSSRSSVRAEATAMSP